MRLVVLFFMMAVAVSVTAQEESLEQKLDTILGSVDDEVVETRPEAVSDSLEGHWIMVKTAIGTQARGFVAGPENASRGILLLHDRWGVSSTMQARVEEFAARGYRALAIDVYDGRASDNLERANELLQETDPETVKTNVLAGISYLKAPDRKIATMGWGFGGWQAYESALMASNDLDAVVVWYAPLYKNIQEARSISTWLLAVFASEDENVSPQMIRSYENMMRKSEKEFRNYVYEADAGFADPQSATYDEAAAKEAWRNVNRFLASFVEN